MNDHTTLYRKNDARRFSYHANKIVPYKTKIETAHIAKMKKCRNCIDVLVHSVPYDMEILENNLYRQDQSFYFLPRRCDIAGPDHEKD
ncbi:hypothetical protein DICVIV_13834 [Dictyocaulus viviparus]|uniref:Uncharacterized protein n=1 Tax=Dictyocaulus viviparus TaxID=29172 RepID=A0A0D8X6R7_DICVI|nr:hypothetical protein DICVIV_13834 [Dictyocaulus viviparus]